MIPLRICLEGFMSYRASTTISFDGSPLWVLVGRNGAGKSALFDAITFVLYGASRGGRQHHEGLINHQADELAVEFDFQLGDAVYRVKRTLARRGRASYQAWRLNRGVQGREDWRPESETSGKAGFDDWVSRTIGLQADTFTAAVLLQQGKSDALLEADPRVRHTMLSQLIDLSTYVRLHERVKARHDDVEARKRVCSDQLNATPAVGDEELAQLAGQVEASQARAEAARGRLRQLAGLLTQAEQWERLEERRGDLERKLAAAQELLACADDIQRDAVRWQELNDVLPRLRRLLEERARLAGCRARQASSERAAAQWCEQLGEATEALTVAKAAVAALEEQQEGCRSQRDAALEKLTALAPLVAALDALERSRHDFADLDRRLAGYPANLDAAVAAQARAVQDLQELKGALPWLRRYNTARVDWRAAADAVKAARASLEALSQDLTRETEEQARRADDAQRAHDVVNTRRTQAAEAQTLLSAARERLRRFQEVDGKPECVYCGQPLTPEHLETERARVQEEAAEAEACHAAMKRAFDEAEAAARRSDTAAREAEDWLQLRRDQLRHQEQQERLAHHQQDQAERDAQDALAALPSAYATSIRPEEASSISDCFMRDYPTPADLDEWQRDVATLDVAAECLKAERADVQARDGLVAQRQPLFERITQEEQRYPAERARQVRGDYAAARPAKEEADRQLVHLRSAFDEAGKRRDRVQATVVEIDAKRLHALNAAAQEQAREEELARTVGDLVAALPIPWRQLGEACTVDEVAALAAERAALDGADLTAAKLAAARSERAWQAQSLRDVQGELSHIPAEARRPRLELAREEAQAQEQERQAEAARQRAEGQKQALEARQRQRADWEEQRKTAAHQAYLYGELTRLLGRDFLQRDLLQQAEAGIVDRANEILDHMSGGALQLALRREDGDTSGSKALDLVAYNKQTGEQPMRVDLLSGSQRFRVAVSLAIGIGRYAGSGTRRMESVIIDEGFGSLDREGLRAVSDELHRLGSALGRIILVSHQEEFASEFVHKYQIKLENGASTAVLVE